MKRVKHSADGLFRIEITPWRTPENEERFDLKIVVHKADTRTVHRGYEVTHLTRELVEQAALGDFTDDAFYVVSKRPAWGALVREVATDAIR